jgi:cell division FtsZ-interacting protein ZapD
MTVGLGDIYEKLKELFTVLEKVRVNTEELKELKKNQQEMQGNILKLMEGQQRILERLEYRKELHSLKVKLAEHIATCEKAKA